MKKSGLGTQASSFSFGLSIPYPMILTLQTYGCCQLGRGKLFFSDHVKGLRIFVLRKRNCSIQHALTALYEVNKVLHGCSDPPSVLLEELEINL